MISLGRIFSQYVLPTAIGAAAAVFTVVLMEAQTQAEADSVPDGANAAASQGSSTSSRNFRDALMANNNPELRRQGLRASFNSARIAELEDKIDNMELPETPELSEMERMMEEEPEVFAAREYRREQQAEQAREAMFDREQRDPGWSDEAEAKLLAGLEGLPGQLGTSVVDTECRTARCRAILKWDNSAQASAALMDVAGVTPKGLNCSTQVWLPESDDPDAEVEARLFLDCSHLRAGLTDEED